MSDKEIKENIESIRARIEPMSKLEALEFVDGIIFDHDMCEGDYSLQYSYALDELRKEIERTK